MSDLRLAWTLSGFGWVDCTIADRELEAVVVASYITAAPEDLLTAVARLVAGESEIRVEFEAEPTECVPRAAPRERAAERSHPGRATSACSR